MILGRSLRVDDVEAGLTPFASSSHAQQHPHRIGYPAAFADHAAHIFFGNLQLEDNRLSTTPLIDPHLGGIIDQGTGNVFE
jgi:hypothetical protein